MWVAAGERVVQQKARLYQYTTLIQTPHTHKPAPYAWAASRLTSRPLHPIRELFMTDLYTGCSLSLVGLNTNGGRIKETQHLNIFRSVRSRHMVLIVQEKGENKSKSFSSSDWRLLCLWPTGYAKLSLRKLSACLKYKKPVESFQIIEVFLTLYCGKISWDQSLKTRWTNLSMWRFSNCSQIQF